MVFIMHSVQNNSISAPLTRPYGLLYVIIGLMWPHKNGPVSLRFAQMISVDNLQIQGFDDIAGHTNW